MTPSLISGGDDEPTPLFTVADLSARHTGRMVRVEELDTDPWAVEGKLYGVHHEYEDKIQLRSFVGKNVRTKVLLSTRIVVGPSEVTATGAERVTFL